MLKRVMVFGAHSYIGFGLCEKLLNEGIEVKGILLKSKSRINKELLDERLMMVGRNALFQVREKYERLDDDHNIDMIIHCCDDGDEPELIEQDQLHIKKSVELAKRLNIPFLFILSKNKTDECLKSEHVTFCEDFLDENLNTRTVIQLPVLFGPFQPPTEKIHQLLIRKIKGEEKAITVDEPILYIKDAVEAVWGLLGELKQGKTYCFHSKVERSKDESMAVEININTCFKESDSSVTCMVKEPTSIEDGLKEQVAYIKKYREILNG